MAFLVEGSDGTSRLRYDLRPYTTLGRSDDNHICVDDTAVSAHHAVIRRLNSGQYRLEDLKTTNGTRIGGEAITGHTLREGDVIHLGGASLRFTLQDVEGTRAPDSRPHPAPTQRLLHAVTVKLYEDAVPITGSMEVPEIAVASDEHSSGNLRQDYERLRAAYELIHAIVGQDDLDLILRRIVDSVSDLLSAERAAVLIVDADGRLVSRVALQRHASGEEFRVSTSILNHVTEHRAAVVCEDLGKDSRFSDAQSIVMESLRSAMCVPMLHNGELVGVLHMDSGIANTSFNQDSLAVVATIANTAAHAVKTAMLKEQIQAMERQRSEAMLALISGASHFINNPLAVICANISMYEVWSATLAQFHNSLALDPSKFRQLHSELGIGFIVEELGAMAADTSSSTKRIEDVVKALLMFEQPHMAAAFTTFDLADLVGEVMAKQEKQISPVAGSLCQLGPAKVYGDRARIQNLLTNLVTNAWQAIEPGAPASHWVVASCHVAGNLVVVSIDDTGRGVAPDRCQHVFAPFATDKTDGSLGLGLAIAAEIARQHGASLRLVAREGGGTRLVLRMPLSL